MAESSSCKTSAHVCFDCRKHRSLQVYANYKKETISCPQCQQPMKSVGHRLQVPRREDLDAWDEFWRQYISPGYGAKGEPEIDAQNRHFESCEVAKREMPKFDESTGCERCDVVWRRMPEGEKDRWRRWQKWQRWRKGLK